MIKIRGGGHIGWFRPVAAVTHSRAGYKFKACLGNRFQAHSGQFSKALSPNKKNNTKNKKSKRNGIFTPTPWDTSSHLASPNFGMTLHRHSRHTRIHAPTLKPPLHKNSRLSFHNSLWSRGRVTLLLQLGRSPTDRQATGRHVRPHSPLPAESTGVN